MTFSLKGIFRSAGTTSGSTFRNGLTSSSGLILAAAGLCSSHLKFNDQAGLPGGLFVLERSLGMNGVASAKLSAAWNAGWLCSFSVHLPDRCHSVSGLLCQQCQVSNRKCDQVKSFLHSQPYKVALISGLSSFDQATVIMEGAINLEDIEELAKQRMPK